MCVDDFSTCALTVDLTWRGADGALQAEGLDAQADTEVDKVIAELTDGLLEGAADAPTAVPEAAAAEAAAAPVDLEEDEKTNAMKARLESL